MVAFSIRGNKQLYNHKQIHETLYCSFSSKPFLPRKLALKQQKIDIDIIEESKVTTTTMNHIYHNPELNNKEEIVVTSTIELPFSAHTAFDAFSDLSRQPTWSHWLKSVQYIQGDDNASLPTTKWTLGWKGFTFSWISRSTKLVRPHIIEWESISGLKNRGVVRFVELNQHHHTNNESKNHKTEMSLTLIFITPKILSRLFNNSGNRIKSAIESNMIQHTLINFRDVVMKQDL